MVNLILVSVYLNSIYVIYVSINTHMLQFNTPL